MAYRDFNTALKDYKEKKQESKEKFFIFCFVLFVFLLVVFTRCGSEPEGKENFVPLLFTSFSSEAAPEYTEPVSEPPVSEPTEPEPPAPVATVKTLALTESTRLSFYYGTDSTLWNMG